MDFIAKYFLYGVLFAGPADRPLFPVHVETDYESPTIGDQVRRLELAGNDRILIRFGRLVNGAFVEDTSEVSGSTLLLDSEGYIRAECGNGSCDYREDGWEYVRENGRYARIRAWGNGQVGKTWEITHQDGRLISAAEGLLQVSWFGNDITRQAWMVRQEPPPLFHVQTYAYKSSAFEPGSDTVFAEAENPFGEPQEAQKIFRLRDGRLYEHVEFDSRAFTRYSLTRYRYQAPLSLPTLARPRLSLPSAGLRPVDVLGRFLPVRPERGGERPPAWGSVGSAETRNGPSR